MCYAIYKPWPPVGSFCFYKTLRPGGLTELVKVSKRVDTCADREAQLSVNNHAVVCLSRRIHLQLRMIWSHLSEHSTMILTSDPWFFTGGIQGELRVLFNVCSNDYSCHWCEGFIRETLIKGVKPCRKLKWLNVMTDYDPDPTLLLRGGEFEFIQTDAQKGPGVSDHAQWPLLGVVCWSGLV